MLKKLSISCLAMYSKDIDWDFYNTVKEKGFKNFFEYLYIKDRDRMSIIYKGKLKKEYKDFDGNQIAILCEQSLSVFGGEIQIDETDGEFQAKIWLD